MAQSAEQSVAIVLDGHADGAVIRAGLSLSSITRRPVVFERDAGALSTECTTALTAARILLGGEVTGLESAADEITFTPGSLKLPGGRVDLADGDTPPIIEMALLPLALGGSPAELHLSGITHAAQGPTFHELAYGWAPLAERIGIAGELRLDSAGFAPEAAGLVSLKAFPAPRLQPLELTQRGMLVEVQTIVLLSNLRMGIALPVDARLNDRLRACGISAQTEVLPLPAERGRGIVVVLLAQFERTRVAFVSVSGAGRSSEAVADVVVDRLQEFLRHRGAVPGSTMEALLTPLAVASSSFGAPGAIGKDLRGTSRVTTSQVTGTLLAVARVAREFLDVEIQVQGLPGDEGLVEVRPAS